MSGQSIGFGEEIRILTFKYAPYLGSWCDQDYNIVKCADVTVSLKSVKIIKIDFADVTVQLRSIKLCLCNSLA